MFRRLRDDEDGVVAPLAALLLVALVGFCALVLDFGTIYANRRSLQNAADAAALAGAKELSAQFMVPGPLAQPGPPDQAAARWASSNGVPNSGPTCTTDGKPTVTYNGTNSRPNSWEVDTSRMVRLNFGPVIGVPTMCVTAHAVAVVTGVTPAKVWPWGLLAGTALTPYATPGTNQSCAYDPRYCFTLKEGAGGSTTGNFGILDFTCANSGTPDYTYWAFNGYGSRPGESIPGPIPGMSWSVCTTSGNTVVDNNPLGRWITQIENNWPPSCTTPPQPSFGCPLVGLIPILQETTWPTGRSTVHIVNFAIFKLDHVATDTQSGTGHLEIVGQFLKYANGVGPTNMPDSSGNVPSGAVGIRLIQ